MNKEVIIGLVLWVVVIEIVALTDANLYKEQKHPSHARNLLIHLCCAAIFGWVTKRWDIAVAALPSASVVFDCSYYLQRGLGWRYVTPKPKAVKDIIEQKIFKKNWWLPKVIYITSTVLILCFWGQIVHFWSEIVNIFTQYF